MLLALETTTSVCSIALVENGKEHALWELNIDQIHSKALTVMIEHLLDTIALDKRQLTAIAISQGPGSYTGVRIGTSVAKGLCFALDIPLIAIDTLQALALQVAKIMRHFHPTSLYLPMIDARRMEVYCGLYDELVGLIEPVKPMILSEALPYPDYHANPICYFGNGAHKAQSLLDHPGFTYLPGIEASASTVGLLAWGKLQNQEFADLAYFEPSYLKGVQVKKPKNKLNSKA